MTGCRYQRAVRARCVLRRAAATVALLSAVALAAGGCGGGTVSAAGHGKPAATARPSASATQIPTGTQLGHLLLSARLPAGWGLVTGVPHSESDTGALLQPVVGPQRGQDACPALRSGLMALTFVDWWVRSNAFISVVYAKGYGPPEVGLTLGAYEPGYAARIMTTVTELARRCRSFRDSYASNYPVTTHATVIVGLGDQNVSVVSVEKERYGSVTGQMILARVGNDLVGVDTNNAGGGNVRPATVRGFAAWLIRVLQSGKKLPAAR